MPLAWVHGFLSISAEMYRDLNVSMLNRCMDGVEVAAFPAMILSLSIVARVRVAIDESDQLHLAPLSLWWLTLLLGSATQAGNSPLT